MNKKSFSIIICTFNRSHLLIKCLESLLNQDNEKVEILVIDNNSVDNTKEIVNNYQKSNKCLKYFLESNIGLSYARNRGAYESNTNWLLYIDDDGIAFPDLIHRALYLISRNDFDCVGGMYFGYFENDPPNWVPKNYGTKKLFSQNLSVCPFDIPHGGIVLYRKELLKTCGGFNPNYGMKGNKIGYGEEVYLQKKMSENGAIIGFDPELKIWHLVKENRLRVKSILISSYALGKGQKFRSGLNKIQRTLKVIISFFSLILYRFPTAAVKYIFSKSYYWQNLILDTTTSFLYHLGRL